jgi:hypothetical protein
MAWPERRTVEVAVGLGHAAGECQRPGRCTLGARIFEQETCCATVSVLVRGDESPRGLSA